MAKHLNRREFLLAAGTASAATLLASCSDDENPPAATGVAVDSIGASFVPTAALITRWRQDPFAFGSYSYLAAGSSSADRVALGAPIGGRLFFAGEASSLDYPATVHGALLSGIEAADAIVAANDPGETVIVIGAGAAGLGAARQLADADVAVTVVEGRDRIGGRVHTDTSLGVPIDLGAGWIHGADRNPLTELAQRFGVKRFVTEEDNAAIYDADGTEVADDQLDEILGGLADLDFAAGDTVGDVVRAAIDDLDVDDAALATYAVTSVVEHETAADIDDLSAEALDEGEEFSGDEAVVPSGYLDVLAPLAAGIDLQLGRIVSWIGHSDEGVEVEFDDASTMVADRVIVTVPLGVLKAGVIEFEPPLPDAKLGAIERLGMGVLDRVVLQYETVFWDADVDLIGYVNPDPGVFIEWDNRSRVVDAPIITGFNAGSVAEGIEALDDDEVVAVAAGVLRTIYG